MRTGSHGRLEALGLMALGLGVALRAAADPAGQAATPPSDPNPSATTTADAAPGVFGRTVDVSGSPPLRTVKVPLDTSVTVAVGVPGERRALVYLHGLCGDPLAFRAFVDKAVLHGTVISLRADVPCPGSGGRFSWGLDYASMDRRIQAALRAVSEARAEPLDPEQVTLVGYSQGAARVAWLARLYPRRYPRVILVGTPTEPRVPRGVRIAVIAGQREDREHMRVGVENLRRLGVEALYSELPGARHGEYGAEAPRVLDEALSWLERPDASTPP